KTPPSILRGFSTSQHLNDNSMSTMNKKIIYSAQSLFFNIEDISTSLRHDLKNRSHSARRRNFAIKKVHHLPAGGKNVSSARLAGGGSF
ncbi:MAG: hypothetical protein AAF149_24345, partial [Bacteroidota bacterium]